MILEKNIFQLQFIADLKDQNLNNDLEKNILAWANKDRGITRSNIKGWHPQQACMKREYKELVNLLQSSNDYLSTRTFRLELF